MKPQEAPPGDDGSLLSRPNTGFQPAIETPFEHPLKQWSQEYLELPSDELIGVCCSGGGIRSASYCLGALQILEQAGLLKEADYLAAVSGGDYIALAHTAVVAATFGDFFDRPAALDGRKLAPESFGQIFSFARNSPEERNLRDDSAYLARQVNGKVWLGANVLYGAIRHLLPFVAGIFIVGAVLGFGFHRWFGASLHVVPGLKPHTTRLVHMDWNAVFWNLWIAVGLLGVAALFLTVRGLVSRGRHPNGTTLAALQGLTMLMLQGSAAVAVLLVALPAALRGVLALKNVAFAVGGPTLGGTTILSTVYVYLSKVGKAKRAVKYLRFLLPVAGLIVIGAPLAGFTYWVTQQGLHLRNVPHRQQAWPLYALFASILILFVFSFLDDVTPSMHLFYREKLAKAFIGMRVREDDKLGWSEPPWRIPLSLSRVRDHSSEGAKLPKLVVCASVNVSDESVPLGRNAGPFTFESDYSGSPLTGYVPTRALESAAGEEVLTMPAMMAIAGAAISPSMGKMTRPALRLLMALFNVRLGVWLPNPAIRMEGISAGERRRRGKAPPAVTEMPQRDSRLRRPGLLYIVREALGLNSLAQRYVYVTDGGHFENLGLVELLRRGCGQIVCLDAAGGQPKDFGTISEAIALARSDLGVEIGIDLSPLEPDDKMQSQADHFCASIQYPNGTSGVLVFARAAMTEDSPQDTKGYAQVDSRFPHHSTADQFFNERRFDAYRSLGAHAARGCLDMLNAYREDRGQRTFDPPPVPSKPCPEVET